MKSIKRNIERKTNLKISEMLDVSKYAKRRATIAAYTKPRNVRYGNATSFIKNFSIYQPERVYGLLVSNCVVISEGWIISDEILGRKEWSTAKTALKLP